MTDTSEGDPLNLVSEIVSAYVSKNSVPAHQMSELITTVHQTLMHMDGQPPEILKPAVPIKKSIKAEHIVCLEDGKKLKMLKRHLRTAFDMSPDDYRKKWGLPHDYPMTAPEYAAQRSELAKKIGLGKARQRGRKKTAA